MSLTKFTCLMPVAFSCFALVFAGILFFAAASPTAAAEKIVTQETLLDRIQIEDILIRYYVDIPEEGLPRIILQAFD